MNKFKITICNKEFALQSDESPSYFVELARKLENQINGMSRSSDSITVHNAALLTALSYADEAKKANDSIDNIRVQIKEYVDDACQARSERDETEKKLKDAKAREKELKAKIAALENEIEILKMQKNIDEQLTPENEAEPEKVKVRTNRF